LNGFASESSAGIYLAKEDKVGSNRKGKDRHLLFGAQVWTKKKKLKKGYL
jgi:hypothetical protein